MSNNLSLWYPGYLKLIVAAKCSIAVTFDSYFLNDGTSTDCGPYKVLKEVSAFVTPGGLYQ